MHLHGGRGQQHEALGALPERAHQREQGVRPAFLRRPRRPAPGMMGFVEHHQVPRGRFLDERRGPVAPAQEVARRDDGRLPMPLAPTGLALVPVPVPMSVSVSVPMPMPVLTPAAAKRRRGIADEPPPVVDRPVEVELLAKLDLPLGEERLRGQDEDPSCPPGEPGLPQQQARLDGLAEPHLVGDEELRGPARVEALERAHLVGPRGHRGGRLADAGGGGALAGGRVPEEGPDEASPVDGRRTGRGLRGAAGAGVGRG